MYIQYMADMSVSVCVCMFSGNFIFILLLLFFFSFILPFVLACIWPFDLDYFLFSQLVRLIANLSVSPEVGPTISTDENIVSSLFTILGESWLNYIHTILMVPPNLLCLYWWGLLVSKEKKRDF